MKSSFSIKINRGQALNIVCLFVLHGTEMIDMTLLPKDASTMSLICLCQKKLTVKYSYKINRLSLLFDCFRKRDAL